MCGKSRGARCGALLALALIPALGGCTARQTVTARASAAPSARPGSPAFVDAAAAAGIRYSANAATQRPRDLLESNGSGCAFLDYDNDGRLDLLLVGAPLCRLYRNDGTRFSDVTVAAGLDRPGHWIGAGVADYDNDGRPDLCLTGYGAGALYHNEGGHFHDASAASGIRFPRWGQSAAWGEVDNDGLLDLYLCGFAQWGPGVTRYCRRGATLTLCGPEMYVPEIGRLYRNLGRGRFQDVTRAAGVSTAHGRTWGAMFQDYDDDGWQDLYLANDEIAGDLFHNLGRGRFRNVGVGSGTAYDVAGHAQGGMAVDWADYDNDGRPDLMVTTFTSQPTGLYHNEGGGIFTEISGIAGVAGPTFPYVGFGGKFLDYDNDGWRDLLLANGHVEDNAEQTGLPEHYRQPALLLRNHSGTFSNVSAEALAGVPDIVARGAAFGDYDNDGRTDAAVMDLEGSPLLLHNEARGGHWIGLRLTGTRSNRDGIGARVRITAGGRRQRLECQTSGSVLSSNDPRLLFGIGAATRVEQVEVRWPSGRVIRLDGAPADRYVSIREP